MEERQRRIEETRNTEKKGQGNGRKAENTGEVRRGKKDEERTD